MKIKAAVTHTKGAPYTIEEVDLAELRNGEVLVKIVASGICHTDVGVQHQRRATPLPAILGHEGSGIIEQVGEGVTGLEPGDHVVLSYAACGKCRFCLTGRAYGCENSFDVNFGGHMGDGTHRHELCGKPVSVFFGQSSFASHSIVAAKNVVKVDKSVPLELLGPLGCGIQTGSGTVLNKLKPEVGSVIAIFGCGSVGLSAIMAAKVAGCKTIIGIDVHESRLALAQELGATHIIHSKNEDVAERITAITGVGLDYAIDTSGIPQVIEQASASLAIGGVLAFVGGSAPGTKASFDTSKMLFERTITGVIQGNSIPQLFIPTLIDLYKKGQFPFEKLLSFYKFEDINQAVEDMHSGKAIKPVIVMP